VADRRELEAYRILLLIVHSLVDDPDAVEIGITLTDTSTTFRVKADGRNLALLLGRAGRTARSIRTVMAAVGHTHKWNYHFVIEGETSPISPSTQAHVSTEEVGLCADDTDGAEISRR
jgi:predicted RNA-binding protein YlqC (UPF0109 family)